jgi:hypothetical protein
MTTSILEEELSQLDARVQQAQRTQGDLEGELRVVEAELGTFASERQRIDALRDVCNALDKLKELKADELFWAGVPDAQNVAGYVRQARSRVSQFEGEIGGIVEKQTVLQWRIKQCLEELDNLEEDVREAYEREERREEEYFVDREMSAVPNYSMAMPWNKQAESERRLRKYSNYAMAFYIFFCAVILLWKLPVPVRPVVAAVPERLVSMLRKVPPKPEKLGDHSRKEEKKPEKVQERTPEKHEEDQPRVAVAETDAARTKAASTGVLAFKDSFKGILEEAPTARLGSEAHLISSQSAAGQARPIRSLVASQSAGGSSGGIGNAGVGRSIGRGNGDRIGGVGFSRVESSVAGQAGEARPLSSGPGSGRTDEDIQIVFDKYKASLYRLYNAELRKNPTLRGKMILRLTIEPGGEVSACTVQSNDLASQELVNQVVERVKKFNFGPKDVSRVTILYPIDFLPAV